MLINYVKKILKYYFLQVHSVNIVYKLLPKEILTILNLNYNITLRYREKLKLT